MPLPLIMAGVQAASTIGSLIQGGSARRRQQGAIDKQIGGLQNAFKFNVSQMLEKAEQIASVGDADTRTRMIQARREAGRTAALNQAAGAYGGSADAVVQSAYGRAGTDVETITTNVDRSRRSVFSDITASRLTLNNQIASLKAGAPQAPNPFLSALSIGASAVGGYVQGGGEFQGIANLFGGTSSSPAPQMVGMPVNRGYGAV